MQREGELGNLTVEKRYPKASRLAMIVVAVRRIGKRQKADLFKVLLNLPGVGPGNADALGKKPEATRSNV